MNKRFSAFCATLSILGQWLTISLTPCSAESIRLQMQTPKVDHSMEPLMLQGRLEQMVLAKQGDKLPLDLTRRQMKTVAKAPTPIKKATAKVVDAKLTAQIPQPAQTTKPLKSGVATTQQNQPLKANATQQTQSLKPLVATSQKTKPINGEAATSNASLTAQSAKDQKAQPVKVAMIKVEAKPVPPSKAPQPKTAELKVTQPKGPQLHETDFAGKWGGDMIITARTTYASPCTVRLDQGDKGTTVVRIDKIGHGNVELQSPTMFFDKPQDVAVTAKQSGSGTGTFQPLFGFFGRQTSHLRYVFLGAGFVNLHDDTGRHWRQEVIHNSVTMIGKDSLEAHIVTTEFDENGNAGEYEERVVRLFRNEERVLYAKIAIAKYAPDRTITKKTLLEGWLTHNWTDAADRIEKVTGRNWDDIVRLYEL